MTLVLTICAAMLYTGTTLSYTTNISAAVKTQGTLDLKKKALIIPNGDIQRIGADTCKIPIGCKYQIRAVISGKTIEPNGIWRSSRPYVAAVSKTGIISAKAAGTTTIKIVHRNKSLSLRVRVIPACRHVYKTTKKATCQAKGSKLCTICGKTAEIKKTAHKWKTSMDTGKAGLGQKIEKTWYICDNAGCKARFDTLGGLKAHQSSYLGTPEYRSHDRLAYRHYVVFPRFTAKKIPKTHCVNCGLIK